MSQRVAIVILNWNGKHFLERFLPILIARTPEDYAHIVVADNGSTDGSSAFLTAHYPQLQQIIFERNYGYTGGYNRALAQIEADYYILLNSDVEVTPGWLPPLFEAMETHPQMGVCMPKVHAWTQPNKFEYAGACGGYIDRFGFPFCRGRIITHIENDEGQYDTPVPVFWASGTCLMVRSALFRRLGGLDEAFFAHMEEIDFCWRVQWSGWQVWVVPQSVILHVGGGTLPNNSPQKLFYNYRNNLYMMYKNLTNRELLFVLPIRLLIDDLSMVAYLIQGKGSFSWAVIRAHWAFYRTHKRLTRIPAKGVRIPPEGVYRASIILRFFLSFRKLCFSDLSKVLFHSTTW